MTVHELKTLSKFFNKVKFKFKTFEVRENDRDFKEGDVLHLKEIKTGDKSYTGNELLADVNYVLKGGKYGLADNYCIMSIEVFRIIDAPDDLPF